MRARWENSIEELDVNTPEYNTPTGEREKHAKGCVDAWKTAMSGSILRSMAVITPFSHALIADKTTYTYSRFGLDTGTDSRKLCRCGNSFENSWLMLLLLGRGGC